MALTAVILAAGKSTRMKSALSKVLHEVCGKPMLGYVLDACYAAGCERVLVVVGYAKEQVMATFADDKRITWVEQTEQLGTGHAAKMCLPELQRSPGDVFILTGDGPLIRSEVLQELLKVHRDSAAAASMATAELDDPTGYGRIVRDAAGEFVDIVEQVDCNPQQRAIREVFPSYYCVGTPDLAWGLARVSNTTNKKGEYYLTDLFGILRRDGRKIAAVRSVGQEDVLAVNTRAELARVDAVMQARIQTRIRESGVTIVSSTNTYIEAGVAVGEDTVIHPFSFLGRDSRIGARCVIGPMAVVPRSSLVAEGTTVAANTSFETVVRDGAGA